MTVSNKSKKRQLKTLQQCQVEDEQLRWQVPRDWLTFNSTKDLQSKATIIGQETAKQALMFGIQCAAYGQNVYVRGSNGTGRLTMIQQLFDELKPKARVRFDRCYVHNFSQPEKPRLLSLPPATAKQFKERINDLADYIENDLEDALNADYLLTRRGVAQEKVQAKIQSLREPIEKAMTEANLALVAIKSGSGNNTQQAIFPVVEGKPIQPDQFFQLVQEGKITEKTKKEFDTNVVEFQRQLHSLNRDVSKILEEAGKEVQALNEAETRNLLKDKADAIINLYCKCENNIYQHPKEECEKIQIFIDEIIQDVIDHRINAQTAKAKDKNLYDVNILVEHNESDLATVVHELTPNLINLLGTVEASWNHDGPKQLNYQGIHAGALLRADGGYLILDVNDLISESGAWQSLKRTLRSGRLEIVPAEVGWLGNANILKPEPIEIDVRVILMGDAKAYYLLDRNDSDFSELFKVLADFDNEIPRDKHGVQQYAQVLANIIYEEKLAHFSREAIACIIEHGARVIAKREKLTAKFSRVADIMREAAYVANQRVGNQEKLNDEKSKKTKSNKKKPKQEKSNNDEIEVGGMDVIEAVKRTKARASLPSKKFQNLVNEGTINIQTEGEIIGQINGLAVIHSGPITYGFPSRITSTIGPGKAGLINIEGQSSMSGSIHTKGFHIISGLLRHILKTDHPIVFSASIAFEQSYGGIDGDSASGAETVCLLSALTNVPIKQSIAMTGAIDQHGKIQAIGGVNEKIEGFYDACAFNGLTGNQGVIIPLANEGDLMLRRDVVDACCEGNFAIYAVDNIYQALEVATETDAGKVDSGKSDIGTDNAYKKGSLLAMAKNQLKDYWQNSEKNP